MKKSILSESFLIGLEKRLQVNEEYLTAILDKISEIGNKEPVENKDVPSNLGKALAANAAALSSINRRMGMQMIPSPS